LIGRCCNAIAGEDVNIEMISQGAVQGSISLVVRQVEGQRAARALHRELFENKGKRFCGDEGFEVCMPL